MSHIDLHRISKHYGLSYNILADILFPTAKYKKKALDRVKSGEANLDIEQVCTLADYLHVSVDTLVVNPSWKGSRENGYIIITRDSYKLIFNKDGFYYSVYDGDTLIDRIVEDLSPLTLEAFINHINNLITNYENDGTKS